MELTIANKESLDRWMNERRKIGHSVMSIKGDAPIGSTYSDGELIKNPVNIAWRDTTTGEIYPIEYENIH